MKIDLKGEFQHGPNWTVVTVGQICHPPQYGYTASAEWEPVGPHMLRITDIQNGAVDWDKVPFCSCPDPRRYLLERGDLLFARTGATTGKSFLVKDCPEAVFASYLIRLRVKEQVLPEFLYWFFQSPQYWEQIMDQRQGIGQPNVNGSKLEMLKLHIPSVQEQARIVARIEEMEDRSRIARAAIRAAREEANKRWRLVEGVVWGDPQVSDMAPLSTVLSSLSNGITTPPKATAGQKILRISAVRPGQVDLSDVRYLPSGEQWNRYILNQGDLLFVRYNGNAELTGVCGMVRDSLGDTAYPDKLIRAQVRDDLIEPEYLELALNTGAALEYIRGKRKTAAGQVGISGGDLKQVPIPCVPRDTQRHVVERCREILLALNSVEVRCAEADSDLQRLESAILSRAFSGRL